MFLYVTGLLVLLSATGLIGWLLGYFELGIVIGVALFAIQRYTTAKSTPVPKRHRCCIACGGSVENLG